MNKKFKILIVIGACGVAWIPDGSGAPIIYIPDEGFMLGNTEDESASFEFSGFLEGLLFRTRTFPNNEFWWSFMSKESASTVQAVADPDFLAARLDTGMEISGSLVWEEIGRGTGRLANTIGDGNFYDTTGFVGVRVFENRFGWDDPDALPYYGWIRVEHSASAETLTVHDWAWNSVQGEPIVAGAIPEPRVYALAFGLGVLGFALARRWRRRN